MRTSNKRKGVLQNIDIVDTVNQILPVSSRLLLLPIAGKKDYIGPISQEHGTTSPDVPSPSHGKGGYKGPSSALGTPSGGITPTGGR